MVQIAVEIQGDQQNCKEWAIVELQGDLETRYPVPLGGKFIGDLHFTKKDAPILIIGHHILHGKVITLEKPLAVIAKTPDHAIDNNGGNALETQDGDMSQSVKKCSTSYNVQAVIKKKILFKTRPKPIIAHVPKKL